MVGCAGKAAGRGNSIYCMVEKIQWSDFVNDKKSSPCESGLTEYTHGVGADDNIPSMEAIMAC